MRGCRVVITGIGMLCPVGNTSAESWRNIVAGKSGISHITRFQTDAFPVKIAGELDGFRAADVIPEKETRQMDEFIHYGLAAGIQAISDAGLSENEADAERIGVSIGSGIGGIGTIERTHDKYKQAGPRRVSPFFVPASIINLVSGHLSIKYNFFGPNVSLVSACTTGAHCIGNSYRMITCGDADVMIAGGAEAAITPLAVAGFSSARALSQRNDDPAAASRPFDDDRDGFVLGEGSGVVVLESYERAKRRGAKIYAEIIGYGMSADGYHITAPRPDNKGVISCLNNALADAEINAADIDYINAHGTSTPLGDIAETVAIRRVLGAHADEVMVSSTKSMTGHLLGAAGGIETIFAALALKEGEIPPTINLERPSPECDLDYVANESRRQAIDIVASNSFGFGGTNATLILAKGLIRSGDHEAGEIADERLQVFCRHCRT